MPVLVHPEQLRRTVPLVTTVLATAHGTTDRMGRAMLRTVSVAVTSNNMLSTVSVAVNSNSVVSNSSINVAIRRTITRT